MKSLELAFAVVVRQHEKCLYALPEIQVRPDGQDYKHTIERLKESGLRCVVSNPSSPRDVVTVLLDCGLRPEECYRLTWENIRDGGVEVFKGKRKASRRRVPASPRLLAILEMRKTSITSEWVFPSTTEVFGVDVDYIVSARPRPSRSGNQRRSRFRKPLAGAIPEPGAAGHRFRSRPSQAVASRNNPRTMRTAPNTIGPHEIR